MVDGMDDLVKFLRARLDEEATEAGKLDDGDDWEMEPWQVRRDETGTWDSYSYLRIAKARVLTEVDAKRRRLARHTPERRRLALNDEGGTTSFAFLICTSCTPNRVVDTSQQAVVEWPCPDLLDDAAVYAVHPDYRDKWRPTT